MYNKNSFEYADTYGATISAAVINATVTSSFLTDCQVTFLESVRTPETFSVTPLCEALADIRNGKYRNLIEALPSKSDTGYREAKTKLPAWAFNGIFANKVTSDNFSVSNELFHFDIDNLNSDDLAGVKKAKLAVLPFCVFVFTSPTRAGLKGAIRVQHAIKSDADFKIAFAQAEAYFQSLGITIDSSCKDVRRLCFVSYDSDVFVNENPIAWMGYELPAVAREKLPVVTTMTSPVVDSNTADECVKRATGILKNASLGEYHVARLRAGTFAGGLVAGGLVDKIVILSALFEVSDEISASHGDDEETIKREHQALQNSFAEGMKEPIPELKSQPSLKKLLSYFVPIDVTELNGRDATQYADLMKTTNLNDYASKMAVILHKPEKSCFVFSFNSHTYRGKVDADAQISIQEILDCTIRILYSIEDNSEYSVSMSHIMEIRSEREGLQTCEITANDLASASAFKIKFANMRLIFQAKHDNLDLLQKALYYKSIPKVRKVKYLGYDEKSGCFVFNQFLYDTAGKRHELNHHGFFDAGIMPQYDQHCINTVATWDVVQVKQFVEDVHTVYGEKGLIAMGFWIVTAFSHKVFEKYNFFPFISLYGEPHTGKSTLTLLLNRCFFVNSEGLSMSKASTLKGEQRQLSKKSGLVTALLEFNNVESATFDLNMLLGAYNRNAISSRAAYSNDNKTIEIDLRCGLAFVQNHEPFKTSAQKERVISLHFAEDSLDTGSEAFKRLTAYKPEDLTGFGDFIFRHHTRFETRLVSLADQAVGVLMKKGGVSVDRIAKNHAIAISGISILLTDVTQ